MPVPLAIGAFQFVEGFLSSQLIVNQLRRSQVVKGSLF